MSENDTSDETVPDEAVPDEAVPAGDIEPELPPPGTPKPAVVQPQFVRPGSDPSTVRPETVDPEPGDEPDYVPLGPISSDSEAGETGVAARVTPTPADLGDQRSYRQRFGLVYVVLAALLLAGIGAFVVRTQHISFHSSANSTSGHGSWSSWKPEAGTRANVAQQIAQHVANEYHLNKKGSQLVAVVSGPPTISSGTHKIAISNIAVKPLNASKAGIKVTDSSQTWVDQFCGLGTACAIATGTPSVERGRLVRREALEVALYTFKFEPAINSIVAFMPPAKGSTASTALFLQKDQFSQELRTPLDQTLKLAKPPLPTQSDTKEAALIDKLTLPSIYSFSVQQLQDSSALLVLDPIPDT